MERLLRLALRHFIHAGNLRVTTAGGTVFTFGDGSGPPVAIRFTTHAAQCGVLFDPELKFGEAYVDGTLVVEQGTIADVLSVVFAQRRDGKPPLWARPQWLIRYLYRRLRQFNPPKRARRNVAHHYDLDGRLYALFLDADRQYSCAYFETPDQTLDDAQLAKKRHLAAKLLIERGDRVLDIGCGWGGLALYLAEMCRAQVTGDHALGGAARAMRAGARRSDRSTRTIEFRLQDYRDVPERFDRIVSVGMFEHVGVGFYDAFFRKCADAARRRRRDGAAFDRPLRGPERHQSLDRKIHLPRRLYPGPVGGSAGDRAVPACWSPTSRSCACTMPRR